MIQNIPHTGVPSPYALAELIARRKIDWQSVPNRPALLEEIFQTPYEDLFDPDNGSLLYIDQKRNKEGKVSRIQPQLSQATISDIYGKKKRESVSNLAELVAAFGDQQLADIPVRAVAAGRFGRIVLELEESKLAREVRLSNVFDKELIDILYPKFHLGYHPDNMSWTDTGRFYNEAAEFFDPIQGAVGDCYLIAALSSVAWSRPFTITDAARATGSDNESFKHRITFYNNGQPQNVEVTDKILTRNGSGSTAFCSSKESGETWPAIYEKAYAKMRLGEVSDYPSIPNIAGGDPVGASAQLTGLSPTYMWHSNFTAAQVLATVQSHSLNGRTTSPITAWTHGSGAEGDVAYRDANIVAGHAYSILGSMRRYEFRLDRLKVSSRLTLPEIPITVPPIPHPSFALNDVDIASLTFNDSKSELLNLIPIRGAIPVDYLIVRNPWGYFEGSGPSTTTGNYQARDVDWLRTIPLGSDGVFAIEVNAFHRYFAGMGFVS